MFQVLRIWFARLTNPPGTARAVVILVGLLCYGTTGFLYFELPAKGSLSWSDALWWSLATLSTVGYGDVSPASLGGRYVVAVPLMLVGIGVLGYVLSFGAAALVEARSREIAGLSTMKMSAHLVIINFPSEAKIERLLDELRHGGLTGPVVLVDEDLTEIPPGLHRRGVRFVRGNPSRDETLTRAAIDDASLAVVLCKRPGDPHSDDLNLAITLAVEARARQVRTVTECVDPCHEELFRKAGCDGIVCTSRFDAHFLGSEVRNPGVQDVIDDLLSATRGQQLCFTKVATAKGARYAALADQCRSAGHIAIGLRRGKELSLNVDAEATVHDGDEMVTIGPRALTPLRAG